MRRLLSLMVAGTVLSVTTASAFAKDATVEKTTETPAQLQAQMHRAVADLIEARAAEKPDEAKIEKLLDKVQYLRGKLWAETGAPGLQTNRQGPWNCPWGGPGVGPGYGPGKGYGVRGRGGRGRGMGPGMGQGRGRGMGRGMGGRGYGMGYGMATGQGRGMGRQWGYIDRNQDGICDNAQPPAPVKAADQAEK